MGLSFEALEGHDRNESASLTTTGEAPLCYRAESNEPVINSVR